MTHRFAAASAVLWGVLLAGATAAQQAQSDFLIVPGERVGPITAATSEAMLEMYFGRDSIQRVDVQMGEGFTEPGTAVFPDDASRRIEVLWRDDSRASPKTILLTGDSSLWRTAEGISLGSTLKEIERLNGFPFRLAGFAWDYGGTILDCDRGRLALLGCVDPDNPRAQSRGRQIVIRLSPDIEARRLPEYRQVIGDRDFSSGHPAMQALNPGVYAMIVSLGP